MRTGTLAVPNSNFFGASFAGCVAVQLRPRVGSNLFGIANGPSGQAEVPALVLLAKRSDDPQPDVILGDEIVPIDPRWPEYFVSVPTPQLGGANAAGGSDIPRMFLDYRAFENIEELARFKTGTNRDLYGNARVANFKRWRLLLDTGAINMTVGLGPFAIDVGECSEFAAYQESGNGSGAAGTLNVFSISPFGAVAPSPLVTGTYGTPAGNGVVITSFTEAVSSQPLPPKIQVAGTAVVGGTLVRVSVIGR